VTRKTAAMIVLVVVLFAVSGCWDYREVDKLPVIVGMAIDINEEGKHVVTAEMVDIAERGKESSTVKPRIISTEGDTLFDALRNAIVFEKGRIYMGHLEMVILGKSVLERGLSEALDFLIRDMEPRMSIWLLASREDTAADLLKAKSVTGNVRTFEISQMIEAQKDLAKSFELSINDLMNLLQCPGCTPVIPSMELHNTEGIETQAMSGTAILKNHRLSGFIDREETKYFCLITDRVKGGILVIDSEPGNNKKGVALEILKNKSKIKPKLTDGKISIEVEIYTKVSIGEHGSAKHKYSEEIDIHRKQAEDLIRNNASALVKKMQTEFDADIFGFGHKIHMNYPDIWKIIENNWDEYFKTLEVTIKPTVEITESGLIQESMIKGE